MTEVGRVPFSGLPSSSSKMTSLGFKLTTLESQPKFDKTLAYAFLLTTTVSYPFKYDED